MEKFSTRLNEAMKLKKVKPIDLVNKTKISKGAISSYMSGNYTPKSKNIYKLAVALNVDPVWLLGYDIPMEEDIKIIKKNDKIELWDNLYGFNKHDKVFAKDLCLSISINYKIFSDLLNFLHNHNEFLINLIHKSSINGKTKKLLIENFKLIEETYELVSEEKKVNNKIVNEIIDIKCNNHKIIELIKKNKVLLSENCKDKNVDDYNNEIKKLDKMLEETQIELQNSLTYAIEFDKSD